MSVVMVASERRGFIGRHPPERIVEEALEVAGEPPAPEEVGVLAGIAHVGFGTVVGAVFGGVVATMRRGRSSWMAMPWAGAVYLVSYAGWIPALGILPRPDRDRPGRAATTIAAHVVYGAALAACWRLLGRR